MKIRVVTIGEIQHKLRLEVIRDWKSEVFSLSGGVESLSLRENAEGPNWAYLDAQLERIVPKRETEDFLLAIVDIELEDSWYSRRLENNRIVLTLHDVGDILAWFGIPAEKSRSTCPICVRVSIFEE